MLYRIRQINEYRYSREVRYSINQLRLSPLTDEGQHCRHFELDSNAPATCYTFDDYFGNRVTSLYLHEPHNRLTIQTIADVEVWPVSGRSDTARVTRSSSASARWQYEHGEISATHPGLALDERGQVYRQLYAEFLVPTAYTTLGADVHMVEEAVLVDALPDTLMYADQLNRVLFENFAYHQGTTTVETTASEFLAHRQGVCQDFAHLMLALCRRRQIPARYVSGYLYCGEDAALRGDAAMHAWVEVHVPGQGWIGFDPTNNVRASDRHIRIAVGRDYGDIVPIQGVVVGGGSQQRQETTVSVSVQRLSVQSGSQQNLQ